MSVLKHIIRLFDKLEDRVRGFLSRWPILYGLITSAGVVLLWRGIWMIADHYSIPGIISAILGIIILLVSGVFVSSFIGNRILMSGLRGEKKITEKTQKEIEEEIANEKSSFKEIKKSLNHIEEEIQELKK